MKKRIVSMFLAFTMAAGLIGCAKTGSGTSGSAASSGTTASATSGEIVLTIPTFFVGENVGAVYFEPAVERFNTANKGKYQIKLEEVVEATYSDKMSQLAQSKTLPALIQTPTTEWVENVMIPSKLYYPMNDFFEKNPQIKELLVEESLKFSTQENGDIVSVPTVTLSNIGLFYNEALYKPAKNVSQMTVDEFAASLGDNKIAFQTVENAWTSMLFLTSLIANEDGGAELLKSYEGTKCLDFNQAPFINAVAKLKEIWAASAASSSVGAAYADAANTFMSNKAAVIANGSWMNSEFVKESAKNWSGDFDGATVRADYYPGNVAICNTATFGRWMVTNGGTDKEREAAFEFLKFIYSKEELETFALTEGCQVPNLTYSDSFKQALSEKPLVRQQAELLTKDTTIVPALASIMVDSVANSIFGTTLVQYVNGDMSAEEFCNILTTKSKEAAEN